MLAKWGTDMKQMWNTYPTGCTTRRAIPPNMCHLFKIGWVPNFHLSLLRNYKRSHFPSQAFSPHTKHNPSQYRQKIVIMIDMKYQQTKKLHIFIYVLPKIQKMCLNPLQIPFILVAMVGWKLQAPIQQASFYEI